MANSDRRKGFTDKNGNMFIPMNVEGGIWNEHFITTPKLITIAAIIIIYVILFLWLNSNKAGFMQYLIWLGIWTFISSLLLRYIVFEEKFYSKMYKELQKHEITTPAISWNVAYMKDTDEGAIITYQDAKIAIVIRVYRDTITGKEADFKEQHYDAISDFYRDVATNRYCFVQMNLMEQAGKDSRLTELDKLVDKNDNPNINKLMSLQVGHIKTITRHSLYENDYFLFYTTDISKIDTIIQDCSESITKLFDGAYMGYNVLTCKEIVDLQKEQKGVNYFNATDASLKMSGGNIGWVVPFTVTGILWDDDNKQKLTNAEATRLHTLTGDILMGNLNKDKVSLKKEIYKLNRESKIGIDFDNLGNNNEIHKNNCDIPEDKLQNYSKIDLSNDDDILDFGMDTPENNDESDDDYIDI